MGVRKNLRPLPAVLRLHQGDYAWRRCVRRPAQDVTLVPARSPPAESVVDTAICFCNTPTRETRCQTILRTVRTAAPLRSTDELCREPDASLSVPSQSRHPA